MDSDDVVLGDHFDVAVDFKMETMATFGCICTVVQNPDNSCCHLAQQGECMDISIRAQSGHGKKLPMFLLLLLCMILKSWRKELKSIQVGHQTVLKYSPIQNCNVLHFGWFPINSLTVMDS
eukprot:11670903-Ditylum_brightwellii.AAC.1